MAYDFNKKIQVGKFDIQIDELKRYGFFEHEDLGDECGGGLWFEFEHDEHGERTSDNRLYLTDYDGVFQLPKDVWLGLEQLGYVVEEAYK